MVRSRSETRTGGRPASSGVIPGDVALSVGRPEKPEPPGWKWTALSDVARLETGHTPSRKHPEYWGGDVPWIGIKDATENHGRVIADTIQHTNDLGIANSSARVLPAHTVCLSRTASVGYVVVMGRPMATSQDFVNWVCSEAIDYRFLKYVLLAENAAFLRFASGTTHQTIYFPEVKAFHVCLPPLPEQRAIAHILGTLDDKIELNRRMNETLEAMARALFKSWFVDFDPVRAKMGAAPHPKSLSRGERDFLPSPPGRGAGGEGTQPAIRANAPIPTQFLDFARQLRRQATDAENLLWRLLRGRRIANAKFRRQYSFPPYILDFYCHELKLAVELDGGQHNEEVGRRRDARRDEYLAGHGIRVLRFWNNDVLRETEAVLEAIYAAVVEHSGDVPSPPAPLPGERGAAACPSPSPTSSRIPSRTRSWGRFRGGGR